MTGYSRTGPYPMPSSYRVAETDLQNVTPDQVKFILRNVRNGQLEDQDRLFRLMLDTWPRLRKAINEVAGSIAKLPIVIEPNIREGEEEPTETANMMRDLVSRALDCAAPKPGHWELDMAGAIRAMVDAYIKGTAVLEVVWHYDHGMIAPRCYAPVPAKFLAYPNDRDTVDRLMLSEDGSYRSNMKDFPEHRFLIGQWTQGGLHPIHAANLRALSKYWLASVYGLGWLMQYGQLFGVPWRHVETDGSDEAMDKAQQMLADIGSSGWAVTGPGVELNLHEGVKSSGDALPQSHMMEVADKACDILLLGQTLTSDNTGTGSRALGDVHYSVRGDILNSVASWVSGVLTNQLVPAILHHNHGRDVSHEDMPTISLEIPVSKDKKELAETFKILLDSGVSMPKKWAYGELGIPIPEQDDEILGEDFADELQEEPAESEEDDFKPHMMYDSAGKGYLAETFEDHKRMSELGFKHTEEMQEAEAGSMAEVFDLEAVRKEVDLQPTEEMAENARKALDVRRQKPMSQRGMTAVGIARARDLINRVTLSPTTVRTMVAWFARHEVDKKGETWDEKGKGWQAWHGWGGDAGKAWAERKVEELERKTEASDASTPAPAKDRLKGSKKNKKGSAKGPRGGIKIDQSTEKALKKKADKAKGVDLGTLKAVWRRGAGAFSTSHRPGMTRSQWSMGRVNAFLRLLKKGRPDNKNYTTDNDLLPSSHPRSTKK